MENFMEAIGAMDPLELALGAGLAGIIATVMLLGGVIWFFVSAFGYRKMFMKAGEAGWKAFIPYYKSYICFKTAWKTSLFWPFLITMLITQYLTTENSFLLSLVALAAAITSFVLSLKLDIRVAKSFGKTTIWGVMLCFFPFIVSFILGYGKAEYIGNTTIETEF